MERIILTVAGAVSIIVGVSALAVIRSDIQIIIGMVGISGGIIMGAQASILKKLSKLAPRQ